MRNLLTFFILFLIFSFGCTRRSNTIFTDSTLWDNYSLKIPVGANKISDSRWELKKDKILFFLEFEKHSSTDSNSINKILNDFIAKDNNKLSQGGVEYKKDTIHFEDFNGIFVHLSKNHNNEVFKVISYATFAILQKEDEIIKVKSSSLGQDYTEDTEKIIRSIKSLGLLKAE